MRLGRLICTRTKESWIGSHLWIASISWGTIMDPRTNDRRQTKLVKDRTTGFVNQQVSDAVVKTSTTHLSEFLYRICLIFNYLRLDTGCFIRILWKKVIVAHSIKVSRCVFGCLTQKFPEQTKLHLFVNAVHQPHIPRAFPRAGNELWEQDWRSSF